MPLPPTWSLVVSDAVRYLTLRPWQPRLALRGTSEPLPQRIGRLRSAWAASRLSDGTQAAEHNVELLAAAFRQSDLARLPGDPIFQAFVDLGIELALQNDVVFDFPGFDLARSLTAAEVEHITDRLIEIQTRIENDGRIHELYSYGLRALLTALLNDLPEAAQRDEPAPFTVPLFALTDPTALVGRFLGAFLHDLVPDTPDAIAAMPFLGAMSYRCRA